MVRTENIENKEKEVILDKMTHSIVEYINTNRLSLDESFELILEFIKIASPTDYLQYKDALDSMRSSDKEFLLASIIDDGYLCIGLDPNNMISFDDIDKIYKKFPWIK